MNYGTIPGCGKQISRILQGTIMLHSDRQAECNELLDGIHAEGCNALDCAHGYGGGGAERAVGKWMADRGNRDEIFILTKGCHFNSDRERVTPFDLSSDLHDSLSRLKTDYIDLYLLHRDDTSIPVGLLVDRLDQHRAEGKILAYGGSNWTPERIEAANEYAARHGKAPFVASSPNFSLAPQARNPYRDSLTISGPQGEAARAYYRDNGMALFTWSSLAQGFLTGQIRRDNMDSITDSFYRLTISSYASEENFQRLDRAEAMGEKLGLTIPQVATAYILNYPLNIFALIGCAAVEEWKTNQAAVAVNLSSQALRWLEDGQGPMPV